jgi:hypothetical protein
MGDTTRIIVVIFLFAVAVLAFFGDTIFGDKVLLTTNIFRWQPWRTYASQEEIDGRSYRTDSARTYLPRRVEATRAISDARFPLWNSYAFCGSPFFADPQTAVVYPVTLLLTGVNPGSALGYHIAIHFFLAMLGMYLFLRAIGSSTMGSLAGGFAFGFSSFFFLRMGHPTFVASASWIPFFFYGYEKARRHERTGTVVLVICLSLGYLAGFPQVFLLGVGALFAYVVYRSIEDAADRDFAALLRSGRVIGISALLSILVTGIQLVPFLELMRNTRDLGFSFDLMKETHLWQPIFMVRSIVPGFFGNPVEGTNWTGLLRPGMHPYNSGFLVYCGLPSILLMIAAVTLMRKSPHIRALLVLLVVSIGMGTSALFLRIGYLLFPAARYSQIDRVSVIACFAIAALAGKGFSIIWGNERDPYRKRAVLACCVVVLVLLAGFLVFSFRGPSMMEDLSLRAQSAFRDGRLSVGTFRLQDWVKGQGREWIRFEKNEIGRALLLGGLGFACMAPLLIRRPGRGFGVIIGMSLLLVLVADLTWTGRRYYVSQPDRGIFQTEGIDFLKTLTGGGRWRIGYLRSDEEVFPSNTPQIFGIPMFGGLSTLPPSGYVDLVRFAGSGDDTSIDARAVGRRGNLADLMSVRYLLSPELESSVVRSSLLATLAETDSRRRELRIIKLGGESRLCYVQKLNQPSDCGLVIPVCKALRFFIGFMRPASVARGDSVTFSLVCRKGADSLKRFEKAFSLDEESELWHEFRLDLSDFGGSYSRLLFQVTSPGQVEEGWVAAWGGLEFILSDCGFHKVEGGYEVDPGRAPGVLGITLRSEVEDLPLTIEYAGDGRKATRWLRFKPFSSARDLMIATGSTMGHRPIIRSPADFTVTQVRRIDLPNPASAAMDPVYDGDMYVYENSAALGRGICVERALFGDATERRIQADIVPVTEQLHRLAEHACGSCEIISYEAEKTVFEAHTDRDCMLLFQDTHYPGWTALVDGNRQPILRTDLGFRALELSGGDHRVEMTFEPKSFRVGLILTCVGIVLTVAYASRSLVGHRDRLTL